MCKRSLKVQSKASSQLSSLSFIFPQILCLTVQEGWYLQSTACTCTTAPQKWRWIHPSGPNTLKARFRLAVQTELFLGPGVCQSACVQSATKWVAKEEKKEMNPIKAPLQTAAGLFADPFAPTPACFPIFIAQIPQLLCHVSFRDTNCKPMSLSHSGWGCAWWTLQNWPKTHLERFKSVNTANQQKVKTKVLTQSQHQSISSIQQQASCCKALEFSSQELLYWGNSQKLCHCLLARTESVTQLPRSVPRRQKKFIMQRLWNTLHEHHLKCIKPSGGRAATQSCSLLCWTLPATPERKDNAQMGFSLPSWDNLWKHCMKSWKNSFCWCKKRLSLLYVGHLVMHSLKTHREGLAGFGYVIFPPKELKPSVISVGLVTKSVWVIQEPHIPILFIQPKLLGAACSRNLSTDY